MRRRLLLAATISAVMLATAPVGRAQTYPSGPVQIIVPYAKGGSADIFARTISDELSKKLGQPVTVDNRPGGGGLAGLQAVSKAAPDGRTLLLGQTGEIEVQPFLMRIVGPLPAPVALVAVIPLAVVVAGNASYATLQDLVAATRSNPRGLSVASPGRLTPGDLAIALFRLRTGGLLASVPFDGGGPALTAVSDGLVDIYFSTLTSAMPYLRAGKIRILAVTSKEPSNALPDVPTMQQAGVSRFDLTQWAGIFAPRGTPKEIVDRLNKEINDVLAMPDIHDKLASDGAKITPMSPAQFASFIRSDRKIYEEFLTSELCSEYNADSCSGAGIFGR